MISNPNYVTDGATVLLGGVDEGREPLLLRPEQVSRAINVTMRGGFPRTRPGFLRRGLMFERGEYAEWFFYHLFQGYGYYDDFRGMEKIMCSIGGRIFLIDPNNSFMVTDITPRKTTVTTAAFTPGIPITANTVTVSDASLMFDGYPIYINGAEYFLESKSGNTLTVYDREGLVGVVVPAGSTVEYLDANSPNQPLAWFEQAEQYMVIQDDQSLPIIFDGSGTRRAMRGEIPTGSVMAYGRGRIWVAVNNGREFVAGDIAGGPTGVLGFLENAFLAGGGAFRIGANVGRIRSMKFVMNLDTSLGQGPLQVLCDRAIYSVNAPTNREAWAAMTDPIQTESLINFGAKGHYSTALVNGDLFFRAKDGLRSFFISRRDFGTWGNTPVSMEVEKTLANDTPELLIHSAAVTFDNRLLFTAVPVPGENGVRHKCLIALDFDLISTMQGKSPPAYDGLWTGAEFTGLLVGEFAGRERCFGFAHGADGRNELWEITKDAKFDNGSYPITSRIEYRSMSFPRNSAPTGLKRLHGAEVWVSEFSGEVDFTLTYKPDQHPCWQDWATKTICITADQCDEEDACDSTTTASNMMGFKTRIGFGVPPDAGDDPDEKAMRAGYSFQTALEWSGYAELNRMMLYAHEQEEWAMAPPSDERSECSAIQCCPPDPFGYAAQCGALDAPAISFWVVFAPSDEVKIGFYAEEGVAYVGYSSSSAGAKIENFVLGAGAGGWQDRWSQRNAPAGEYEEFWIEAEAAGDCAARTSPRSRLLIIY